VLVCDRAVSVKDILNSGQVKLTVQVQDVQNLGSSISYVTFVILRETYGWNAVCTERNKEVDEAILEEQSPQIGTCRMTSEKRDSRKHEDQKIKAHGFRVQS